MVLDTIIEEYRLHTTRTPELADQAAGNFIDILATLLDTPHSISPESVKLALREVPSETWQNVTLINAMTDVMTHDPEFLREFLSNVFLMDAGSYWRYTRPMHPLLFWRAWQQTKIPGDDSDFHSWLPKWAQLPAEVHAEVAAWFVSQVEQTPSLLINLPPDTPPALLVHITPEHCERAAAAMPVGPVFQFIPEGNAPSQFLTLWRQGPPEVQLWVSQRLQQQLLAPDALPETYYSYYEMVTDPVLGHPDWQQLLRERWRQEWLPELLACKTELHLGIWETESWNWGHCSAEYWLAEAELDLLRQYPFLMSELAPLWDNEGRPWPPDAWEQAKERYGKLLVQYPDPALWAYLSFALARAWWLTEPRELEVSVKHGP